MRTGRGSSHTQGLGRSSNLIKAFDASKSHHQTNWYPFTGRAEPAEFPRVEFNIGIAKRLIEDKSTVPVSDGQTVGLRVVVKIVRRDQASGTGHVFDHGRRVAGHVFIHKMGDGASVGIIAAARRLPDDETRRLVFVEILRKTALCMRQKQNQRKKWRSVSDKSQQQLAYGIRCSSMNGFTHCRISIFNASILSEISRTTLAAFTESAAGIANRSSGSYRMLRIGQLDRIVCICSY